MIHHTKCDRCGTENTGSGSVTVREDIYTYEYKLCGRCAFDALKIVRDLLKTPPTPQYNPWGGGTKEKGQ